MGVESIDPRRSAGTYVDPDDWNALVDDPDTLVIDTRNSYETAIGSFEGAIDPGTEYFRDFPAWADTRRCAHWCTKEPPNALRCSAPVGFAAKKPVAICRTAASWEVHHLRGGILKYLETVPEADSGRWRGECFVFDQRVALNHRLEPGEHSLCYACGLPLSPEQRDHPSTIQGVQCVHCVDRFNDADRERFAMRQRQMEQKRQGR